MVLSGTHGSNKDLDTGEFCKIPICGFSNERCLTSDNPKDPKYDLGQDFYKQDLERADELMKKHKNLKVVVKHMKHFSKAQTCVEKCFGFDKKKKLRKYVLKEKPNMLIMAWCYSANCDVSMVLRTNAEICRLVLEAEMRDIGISPGKYPLNIKITVMNCCKSETNYLDIYYIKATDGQSYMYQVLQTLTLYCGTHIGLCVQ